MTNVFTSTVILSARVLFGMNFRRFVWIDSTNRARAPVRLVVGFFLIALVAVVGTVVAELTLSTLWPSIPFAYYLVGTTVGLGLGALVGVAVVARYIDRRSLAGYGLQGNRAWWRDLAVGVALATTVQAVVVGIGLASGWAVVTETVVPESGGFALAMLASLALFVVVGLYEELVVRGFVLTNIAEGFAGYGATVAAVIAIVGSSLLFGAIHLANANASLVAVAGIAVVAVTLGVSYVLTGRLGLAIGFHAAWNTAMGVLFGYPVSGFEAPASVLVVDSVGPTIWTGGAFGPEAGLLGVLAAVAGLAGVVAYARLVEGRIGIHPGLFTSGLRGVADSGDIIEATTGGEESTDGDLTVGYESDVDPSR